MARFRVLLNQYWLGYPHEYFWMYSTWRIDKASTVPMEDNYPRVWLVETDVPDVLISALNRDRGVKDYERLDDGALGEGDGTTRE